MDVQISNDTELARTGKLHTHDALTKLLYEIVDLKHHDLVVERTTSDRDENHVYIHLHKQSGLSRLNEDIVWWVRYQMTGSGRVRHGSEDFVVLEIPYQFLKMSTVFKAGIIVS